MRKLITQPGHQHDIDPSGTVAIQQCHGHTHGENGEEIPVDEEDEKHHSGQR